MILNLVLVAVQDELNKLGTVGAVSVEWEGTTVSITQYGGAENRLIAQRDRIEGWLTTLVDREYGDPIEVKGEVYSIDESGISMPRRLNIDLDGIPGVDFVKKRLFIGTELNALVARSGKYGQFLASHWYEIVPPTRAADLFTEDMFALVRFSSDVGRRRFFDFLGNITVAELANMSEEALLVLLQYRNTVDLVLEVLEHHNLRFSA